MGKLHDKNNTEKIRICQIKKRTQSKKTKKSLPPAEVQIGSGN